MSLFCAVLAEHISINLQNMNRESQSLLTFTVFACIRFVIQIECLNCNKSCTNATE